jgi:hypothetical protein
MQICSLNFAETLVTGQAPILLHLVPCVLVDMHTYGSSCVLRYGVVHSIS